MTLPSEVPENSIVVEGIGGHWAVIPHNQPVERFDKRADAIHRANEIANERVIPMKVIVKAGPGPFYE